MGVSRGLGLGEWDGIWSGGVGDVGWLAVVGGFYDRFGGPSWFSTRVKPLELGFGFGPVFRVI